MEIEDWIRMASEDAARHGRPELAPLLASLARSTAGLREADRVARLADPDAASATRHLKNDEDRP